MLAEKFEIKIEKIDITTILDSLGVYKIRYDIVRRNIPQYRRGDSFCMAMPQNLLQSTQLNIHYLDAGDRNAHIRSKILSATDCLNTAAATQYECLCANDASILYC
jgi:hypothetical protein